MSDWRGNIISWLLPQRQFKLLQINRQLIPPITKQTMTRQNDRNADLSTSTTVSNSKWRVWLILYLCIHWWSGRWKIRCSRRSICCVSIYPIQLSGCSSRDKTFSHQVHCYMAGLRAWYNIINNNCKGRTTSNPRCKSNTISIDMPKTSASCTFE